MCHSLHIKDFGTFLDLSGLMDLLLLSYRIMAHWVVPGARWLIVVAFNRDISTCLLKSQRGMKMVS